MRHPARFNTSRSIMKAFPELFEEAAVGCLQKAITLCAEETRDSSERPTSNESAANDIAELLEFYLVQTESPSPTIAAAARYYLIHHGVPLLYNFRFLQYPAFAELTEKILNCFVDSYEFLTTENCPAVITGYLVAIHGSWHNGPHPQADAIHTFTHNIIRGMTGPIVTACCAWELGYLFSRENTPHEVIPYLEAFLASREYNPHDALRGSLVSYESEVDHTLPYKEAEIQAALAFMRLVGQEKNGKPASNPRAAAEKIVTATTS